MIRPSQRFFSRANLDPRLKRGLVGHWIGGGSGNTWSDRSGYGNHAALSGGASWKLGAGGKRAALSLDGSQAVVVQDSPILSLGSQFSIALWFRPENLTQAPVYILGKLSSGGGDNAYALIWEYSNNIVRFYAQGGPVGHGSTNTDIAIASAEWHHIAYTYDGSTFRSYLNGVEVNSAAVSFSLTAGTGALYLGAFDAVSARIAAGLDDVRIYVRGLGPGEVALLARPSSPAVVPRRWYTALPSSQSTNATSSVSTWVSPTASTRASVAASPSIASWASPTASTKASVSASPSVSTWVVPSATTRTPRIMPTVGVSRTVYANIPASRTVYDPIEVS